ncbi:phosphoribosylformimino-5-aminoimidazole carboxamide ribotide isomerase [Desulforhopalus sp. IMCC35007]|uniref:phosphoribosylformimino-5-aminoimidazole carboxamide ribotide isomerase n=1 Tax=Desulforhopalus sp. IMCC35007 TaxID=2569543 RepID=UPI0010AE0C41|nr:phosphoribosylformimino-5-aminoimidazole carboxamide ribotide isomerase [Desulforhopalus sp. IMCC35007]TKB06934.1 phosphoribosylformimino-5-aminoimidazole carboxamide ribotide isomerase [Desulforhopalus sp. IMCC35007]
MRLRPCIDLHAGLVKQIVGSTLCDDKPAAVQTNFVAQHPPSWFSSLYKKDNLTGGHIIKLGPGNDEAAIEALAAWPKGMQLGGGVTADNARFWLEQGASHVIVTSFVFKDGAINMARLRRLVEAVGKKRIVLDLSCRKKDNDYYIVTDRWQKFTQVKIDRQVVDELANYCDEFLIHAADVEGKCNGIEEELVRKLGAWVTLPTTYAGGVRNLSDLQLIKDLGADRLDVTVGSALDIFGGNELSYRDAVDFCSRQEKEALKR